MVTPELTRLLTASSAGYPLSDLSKHQKLALIRALRAAWAAVQASGSVPDDEDSSTTLIVEHLRAIQVAKTVPGFSMTTFETPIRDGKEVNFNGCAPDKMPDITFRPTGETEPRRAWSVEAKVVSKTHGVADYINKGITRFERGDYAWAMPSAAMIAYNDSAYVMEKKLNGKVTLAACAFDAQARESTHARTFCYVGHAHGPGDITLVHVWFR